MSGGALCILEVRLRNFRSFKKERTFAWPVNPAGFYLLTGDNRLNPDMGANAVGKSSLWDALCWAWYGRSARGLRGPALANWAQASNTFVEVRFSVRGKEHLLRRSWSPNGLWLDGQIVEQPVVDDLIGMRYEVFLHTLLLGQFGTFFFDLAPQAKLDLFSSVLGLDYWSAASKRAAAYGAQIEGRILAGEKRCSELRSQIKTMRIVRAGARKEAAAWEQQHRRDARKARKRIRALRDRVDESAKVLQEANAEAQETTALLEDVQRRIAEHDGHRSELRDKGAAYGTRLARLQERLRAVKAREPEAVCSLCAQAIPHQHLRRSRVKWKKRLEKVERRLSWVSSRSQLLELEMDSVASALRSLLGELQTHEASQRKASQRRNAAAQVLAKRRAAYDEAKRSLAEVKETANPHKERAAWALREIKSAKAQAETALEVLRKRRRLHAGAGFWGKGFKEVRLWVVEKALRELEVSVNSSLVHLGLTDWSVEFDVERETKSGAISRGFQVLIKSPESKESVPWEAWCGGETQRLRIAGAAGLSDLVCARLGIKPAFEVWDEPTAHLSEEGVLDLLDFLKERSTKLQRQVWLTDHRSHPSGTFDARYIVLQDEKGSRILSKKATQPYHQRGQWERLGLIEKKRKKV